MLRVAFDGSGRWGNEGYGSEVWWATMYVVETNKDDMVISVVRRGEEETRTLDLFV